jgi:hypothetical protein
VQGRASHHRKASAAVAGTSRLAPEDGVGCACHGGFGHSKPWSYCCIFDPAHATSLLRQPVAGHLFPYSYTDNPSRSRPFTAPGNHCPCNLPLWVDVASSSVYGKVQTALNSTSTTQRRRPQTARTSRPTPHLFLFNPPRCDHHRPTRSFNPRPPPPHPQSRFAKAFRPLLQIPLSLTLL